MDIDGPFQLITQKQICLSFFFCTSNKSCALNRNSANSLSETYMEYIINKVPKWPLSEVEMMMI